MQSKSWCETFVLKISGIQIDLHDIIMREKNTVADHGQFMEKEC